MENIDGYLFLILVFAVVILLPALLGVLIRKRNPPMPFWGPLFRLIYRKLRP